MSSLQCKETITGFMTQPIRRQKLYPLIIICMLVIILSGCSALNTNTEELIELPNRDALVVSAIDLLQRVEGDEISVITSLRGKYQNGIIYKDIDGDEDEEIIISYRDHEQGDSANIYILKKNGAGLSPMIKISGAGTGIDMLSFADFNGDGLSELVVGYISTYDDSTTLYIYELDFVNHRVLSYNTRRYSDMIITDADGDGNDDLVLVYFSEMDGVAYARLYKYDRSKDSIREYSCEYDTLRYSDSFYCLSEFTTDTNQKVIYVCSGAGTLLMTTELLVWDREANGLVNISTEMSEAPTVVGSVKAEYTSLGTYLPCDIDGDGYTEIPICNYFNEETVSYNLSRWKESLLYEYSWNTYSGNVFTTKFTAYVNKDEMYLVKTGFITSDRIKAYLNYNSDMLFYYVPEEKDAFPVLGEDNRTLLFSITSTEDLKTVNEYNIILAYSKEKHKYYMLNICSELPAEIAYLIPSAESITDSFKISRIISAK